MSRSQSIMSSVSVISSALEQHDDDTKRVVMEIVHKIHPDASHVLIGETAENDSTTYKMLPPSVEEEAEARPTSIVEFIEDFGPKTEFDHILAFCYYRRQAEKLDFFSKADIRPYFNRARCSKSNNYSACYEKAVKAGYICDRGDKSYLTKKGEAFVVGRFSHAGKP